MYSYSESVFDIRQLITLLYRGGYTRLVLFGAGGWGKALCKEICKYGIKIPIVFADNDPTKTNTELMGKLVISPDHANPAGDIVAITTISAGDRVSSQLEALGFERGKNYLEVMKNTDVNYPFEVCNFYKRHLVGFNGANVLHVGPGGHLGVELLIHAMGARSVSSVEYNSFGLLYPDVTDHYEFYQGLSVEMKKRLKADPFRLAPSMTDLFENGALLRENEKLFINTEIIKLWFPYSLTRLPFDSNFFDIVLHHAVLEHVSNPQKGYEEIYRVLKPGGKTVGLVDPQDHRTFSSKRLYHPLKFLEYSQDQWQDIAGRINYHNRATMPEHRHMIARTGFKIEQWQDLMTMDISDRIWSRFHSRFRQFSKKDIGVLRFSFSAVK